MWNQPPPEVIDAEDQLEYYKVYTIIMVFVGLPLLLVFLTLYWLFVLP